MAIENGKTNVVFANFKPCQFNLFRYKRKKVWEKSVNEKLIKLIAYTCV